MDKDIILLELNLHQGMPGGNVCAGFFGKTTTGVTIKNLGLESGTLTASSDSPSAGAILGWAHGTETVNIQNCYSKVDLNGCGQISHMAGILGKLTTNANITSCYNKGNFIAPTGYTAAGIVSYTYGNIQKLVISNCYNVGTVWGKTEAGGIVGEVDAPITTEITNCYNTGTIKISDSWRGYVGGIIALDYNDREHAVLKIEKSYNKGDLQIPGATAGLGGIIGKADVTDGVIIKDCYNTGNLKGAAKDGDEYLGGIAGFINLNRVENCYNTGSLLGDEDSGSDVVMGGVVGYTDTPTGDKLVKNCYNEGTITATPGNNTYLGGVVGYAPDAITVQDCHNGGSLNSNGGNRCRVGGVCGEAYGNVYNCYNTGTINGTAGNETYVGGIIGYSCLTNLKNCYNTGDVNSKDAAGGIIGDSNTLSGGSLTNCFNAGATTATQYAGGISGEASDVDRFKYIGNAGSVSGTNAGGIIGKLYSGTTLVDYGFNSGTLTGTNTGNIIGSGSANATNSDSLTLEALVAKMNEEVTANNSNTENVKLNKWKIVNGTAVFE